MRCWIIGGMAMWFAAGSGTLEAATEGASLARTNLMCYRDGRGAILAVKTVADWERRRESILKSAQKVMGRFPAPEKRCGLDARIEAEADCGSFVRRTVSYAPEPGARLRAYLLAPKGGLTNGARLPAVLALHPTQPLGAKVVVGLGDSPKSDYGVELAQRGFVVLAPPYPLLADYNPDLKALGYQSGTMKAIWDNVRGLDFLASLPFVRTNGFGAIGHSLGGHNAVFTAVFDRRIQAVVSSCGLDSFVDYMDGRIAGWTSERYMPRLLDYALLEIPFDFHELIGALAPRRCLVIAPYGDTNFKWRSVDGVAQAASGVYGLYGRPENLRIEHPDCGHIFPPEMRELAYEWLAAALK